MMSKILFILQNQIRAAQRNNTILHKMKALKKEAFENILGTDGNDGK